MKHTLKSRTICLATALAATALLAGCSKENAPEKAIEPEPYDKEVTLYVTDQNKVLKTGSSLTYPDNAVWEPEGVPFYLIEVSLNKSNDLKKDTAWITDGTKYIRRNFTTKPVTGIEVIAGSDYDAAHPKGSPLNDLMVIKYPKSDGPGYLSMDLMDYFQTYTGINWTDDRGFRLVAKTPPLKENEIKYPGDPKHPGSTMSGYSVTLRLTLEDGTVIETVPNILPPIPTE